MAGSRTLCLTGRLIDEAGRPLGAARYAYGPLTELTTPGAASGRTLPLEADGAFAIEMQRPAVASIGAAFAVAIGAEGRAAVRCRLWSGRRDPWLRTSDDGRADVGDLVLPPASVLAGRVVDERGEPVANAHVRSVSLLDLDAAGDPAWWSATRTDADGGFRISSAPPAPVALLVTADGCYDRVAADVTPGGDAEIVVRRSGYVVGPLARAAVVFVAYEAEGPPLSWDGVPRPCANGVVQPAQIAAAAAGTFRATVRFPGAFRMRAVAADGAAHASSPLLQAPATGVALTWTEVGPRTVSTAQVTGRAPAGAWIRAARRHDRWPDWSVEILHARSGDDGSFAFTDLVPATYELTLVGPRGQRGAAEIVTVRDGETRSIELRTPPAATITGTLSDATAHGTRVVLARERVVADDDRPPTFVDVDHTTADATGRFTFTGVPPGRYRVAVEAIASRRVQAALARRDVADLTLCGHDAAVTATCPPDLLATVTGRIVLDGAPIPHRRLLVVALPPTRSSAYTFPDNTAREPIRAGTDVPVAADGSFALRVAAGRYRLDLFDAVTGLLLATSADRNLPCAEPITLPATVAHATLTLGSQGGGPTIASSIRVLTALEASLATGVLLRRMDGTPVPAEPEGPALWIGDRPDRIELFVPPGEVRLFAASVRSLLDADETNQVTQQWIGTQTFVARSDEPASVHLETGSPETDRRG